MGPAPASTWAVSLYLCQSLCLSFSLPLCLCSSLSSHFFDEPLCRDRPLPSRQVPGAYQKGRLAQCCLRATRRLEDLRPTGKLGQGGIIVNYTYTSLSLSIYIYIYIYIRPHVTPRFACLQVPGRLRIAGLRAALRARGLPTPRRI